MLRIAVTKLKAWAARLWGLSTTQKLILLLAFWVVAVAGAFWVLITPTNPLTSYFRKPISDVQARVIIGPYPVESDFQVLKKNRVETIVTLLDPSLPYERVALYRELVLANRYNMRVLNFPMTSVLGQGMGEYYSQDAAAAAEAIQRTPGKVYVHCYLGMHRTAVVREMLRARGIVAGRDFQEHALTGDAQLWEEAQGQYGMGNFQETLHKLNRINKKNLEMRRLEAWSTYRMGDLKVARRLFESIVAESDNPDARTGLGYCALRQNDLATAAKEFELALKKQPASAGALSGLGMVRFRQGKATEACDSLGKALQSDPGNQEARAIFDKLGCSPGGAAAQNP